jgi:sarcosine oxidase
MATNTHDVIVIGLGGMGSATVLELARRGRRVLGLEQFSLGHNLGSSHGQTRIIRMAYYEHPDYVPLLRRAYGHWSDLETQTGRRLFTACGVLTIGRDDSELILGVEESARQHSLAVESLSMEELRRRFPAFQFGPEFRGLLEHHAGFLTVEECVRTCLDEATRLGAELHEREPVVSWNATRERVEVRTESERYEAARLVLTAGPWAASLLERRGVVLSVMRQVMLWFEPSDPTLFRREHFPCFIADIDLGQFYGVPAVDENGPKVARHYGAPELKTPAEVDREAHDADATALRPFLRRHLPGADGRLRRAATCIYTLTPDRHFILDVHPEHASVCLAAGFSGHGFKFATVVGEIMADLAEKGRSDLPLDLFRLARFFPAS